MWGPLPWKDLFQPTVPQIPGLLAHPHFLGTEFSKKRCAKFSWYRNPPNSIEIYHVESSFPHQNRWFLDARWSWVVLLPRRTWHCYHEQGHTVGVVYIYIHVLYHNIYIYIHIYILHRCMMYILHIITYNTCIYVYMYTHIVLLYMYTYTHMFCYIYRHTDIQNTYASFVW